MVLKDKTPHPKPRTKPKAKNKNVPNKYQRIILVVAYPCRDPNGEEGRGERPADNGDDLQWDVMCCERQGPSGENSPLLSFPRVLWY
jgi:hypothetical protein